MGQLFEFKCTDCGYTATVSGGLDYGRFAVVRTMICQSCREIVDVQVGVYGQVGARSGDPKLDAEMNRCPACQRQNVLPWKESDSCPKCGGDMAAGEDAVVCWD